MLELRPLERQHIEQMIELVRERPELVTTVDCTDPGLAIATIDTADHPMHALDRPEDAARPMQRPDRTHHTDYQKEAEDDEQGNRLRLSKRRFEKSDVEHAYALAPAVDDGLVAGHIPVIDHESRFQPGPATHQHVVTHLDRSTGTERTLTLKQADIGGNAGVTKKQRRGALAAERQ
ncbi:hypothetical protein SDC9_123403 [bioreactor metagenome]|uniref:Uncharacterized protein n=1 Tax=bioreactor metagenome TaxID=1076179 RepID=A0A645CHJ2_9ZZZZ